MAKTAQEIKEQAEEVVAECLEIVEELEKANNSFFRRVPKPAIDYLFNAIRQLSTTVLNLSGTAAAMERRIALQEREIDTLQREKLDLQLKLTQIAPLTDEN